MTTPPVCLTIAGLDPSGGAGTIADIKTFSAFGCFPAAAVASITFQNTTAVFGAEHQTAATVRAQLEPIFADYVIGAVKTGMLPTREVIEETAAVMGEHAVEHLVVDPVVRSTSGFDLIDDAALNSLVVTLFPLSSIITPNIPEAERISGMRIQTSDDIKAAGVRIQAMGAKNVLIKGGHLENSASATDYLFLGDEIKTFDADFIQTSSTHGTGCTLSAAIAANLALGRDLVEAVRISKAFVHEAIRTAPDIGQGHSPINIKAI